MPQDDHRSRTLRVATYNVHRCRGMDARTVPQRIASVLAQLDADAIALQEVLGASQRRPGQAAELGAALGMGWVMAPTRHLRGSLYGNVVLSRLPIRQHVAHDLSWKTCEPRGVQRVDLALDDDHSLHLYNVHLGTALLERRYQADRLAHLIHDRRTRGPKVVLGDFNEWARGLATDILSSRLHSVDLTKYLKRGRTYPGFFPLFHLDHIYYEGRVEVRHVELIRTRQALMASDHLPLVADLTVWY
jgi:endonuclease/exonuclease/phosphatase family metal-dependent hydrolase